MSEEVEVPYLVRVYVRDMLMADGPIRKGCVDLIVDDPEPTVADIMNSGLELRIGNEEESTEIIPSHEIMRVYVSLITKEGGVERIRRSKTYRELWD